jgi:hypothetical protein
MTGMKAVTRRIFGIVLLLSCSVTAHAGSLPDEVVSAYVSYDYSGGRLKGVIPSMVVWEHEPGWDQTVIVDDVSISSAKYLADDEASVLVTYHVVGFRGGVDLVFKARMEHVAFKLKKLNEDWLIVSPVIPPHVTANALLSHLRELLAHDDQDASLKKLIYQLEHY